MSGPLTNEGHELFAQELAKGTAQFESYRKAGYKGGEQHACRLAKNPKVRARVEHLLGKAAQKAVVDAAWVLRRLSEEIDADIADLYDEAGKVKPIHDWPPIWRKGLVAGIETFQEQVGKDRDNNPIFATAYKLRLAPRDRRLEMLGKHVYVSAFREQIDHSSTDGSMSPPSLADFYAGVALMKPRDG